MDLPRRRPTVERTTNALAGKHPSYIHPAVALVPADHSARPPLRFTLIVATVGRHHELAALLETLATQTYPHFDVIIVDQNVDDHLEPLIARYSDSLNITHLRSAVGLSRARNVGLQYAQGDILAFPDDDCVYPATVLENVAAQLAEDVPIEGVCLHLRNADGEVQSNYERREGLVTKATVFRQCCSVVLFMRASLIRRTGPFNEKLGFGAGTPWASAEDLEYPLRAISAGCRIKYVPELHVVHALGVRGRPADAARKGFIYGGGLGWILRNHKFSAFATINMLLIRPVGGVVLGAIRLRPSEICFYAAMLAGRVRGWLLA